MTLDEGTKAYLAALVDIHATIRIQVQKSGSVHPIVMVNTTDKRIADLLGGLTDAGVSVMKYKKREPEVPSAWRWGVSGAKATVLLVNLRPYFYFQTTEADAAIVAGLNAEYRPSTGVRMRRIGWTIPEQLSKVYPEVPSEDEL